MVEERDAPDRTLKQSRELDEEAIRLSQACEGALEYARQKAQALADVRDDKDDSGEEPSEGVLDL